MDIGSLVFGAEAHAAATCGLMAIMLVTRLYGAFGVRYVSALVTPGSLGIEIVVSGTPAVGVGAYVRAIIGCLGAIIGVFT
jgi:nitrogenase subunit NifH